MLLVRLEQFIYSSLITLIPSQTKIFLPTWVKPAATPAHRIDSKTDLNSIIAETLKQIALRLPPELFERIDTAAKEAGQDRRT